MPMYYLGFPGANQAASNIEDVAHHTGNWVKEVPEWYSWKRHCFVSNWLGTRSVRDYLPYDYQEGTISVSRTLPCAPTISQVICGI
jgi:hypothetical protein